MLRTEMSRGTVAVKFLCSNLWRMPKRVQTAAVFREGKRPRAAAKEQLTVSSAATSEQQPTKQLETPPVVESVVEPLVNEAPSPTTSAQEVVIESVLKGKHPEVRELLTEPGWKAALEDELDREYFTNLQEFLESEWDSPTSVVYPPARFIFDAFQSTPYDQVRVVLLGQDPYHGPNQATGLSFSVPKSEKIPGSLKNVYKEIESDVGYHPGTHGDISNWAKQGVLLLNTVLTVRASKAHSHRKKGWENFTNHVVSLLNNEKSNLVFLLWGAHAQRVGATLDEEKHLVLKCAHPSGLSAHRGFFGSKHFSKCNDYLESLGKDPIDWKV